MSEDDESFVERPYWKPRPPPTPLDEQGVHEAVFRASRSALKMQTEEELQHADFLTGLIKRDLTQIITGIATAIVLLVIIAAATMAIAVKLWLY